MQVCIEPDLCKMFTSKVCDDIMKSEISTFTLEDSGLLLCHKIDSSNP